MGQLIELGDRVFKDGKNRLGYVNAERFYKEFMEPSENGSFVDEFANVAAKMFHSGPNRYHFNVVLHRKEVEIISEYMCKAQWNGRGRKLMRHCKANGGKVPSFIRYLANYSIIWGDL